MKKVKELALPDYQARLWANVVRKRSCMSDAQLDAEIIRCLGLQEGTPDQDFFYRFRKETSRATYACQPVDVNRIAREFEIRLPGLEETSSLFCSRLWEFLRGSTEQSGPEKFDLFEEVQVALRTLGCVRLNVEQLFASFPFCLGLGEVYRAEFSRYLNYRLTSRRLRYSAGFVLDKLHAFSLLLLEAEVNGWFTWERCWRLTIDFVLNSGEFSALFHEAGLNGAKARKVFSDSIDRRIAELRMCCRPTGYALWVVLSEADAAELNRRGQLVRQILGKSREFMIRLGNGSDGRIDLVQDLQVLRDDWQNLNRMLPKGRFGEFWNDVV